MININLLKHRAWIRVERALKAQVGLIVLNMESDEIDVRGKQVIVTVEVLDDIIHKIVKTGKMEIKTLK